MPINNSEKFIQEVKNAQQYGVKPQLPIPGYENTPIETNPDYVAHPVENDPTQYEAFGVGADTDYVNLYYSPERLNRRFPKAKLTRYDWAKVNIQTAPQYKDKAIAQVSRELGIPSTAFINNDELLKSAAQNVEYQRNFAYMQGKPYTPQSVAMMYPEVDTGDPIETSAALRDWNNVLESRGSIFAATSPNGIIGSIENSVPGKLISNSWKVGSLNNEINDVQYAFMNGDIDQDEAERRIFYLNEEIQKTNPTVNNTIEKIVSGVAEMLPGEAHALKYGFKDVGDKLAPLVPVLPAITTGVEMAPATIAVGLMGMAGAIPAVAALAPYIAVATISAAGAVGKAAVYEGTKRMEAANAYWQLMHSRNVDGTPKYTAPVARNLAETTGRINGAVEVGLLSYSLKGIEKALGKESVKTIIKDATKRNSLLQLTKSARIAGAIKYAGKQALRETAAETFEEGVQQANQYLVEDVYDAFHKDTGGIQHGAREIFKESLDAMWQALPGAFGSSLIGAGIAGAAFNHNAKAIASSQFDLARQEIERNNEVDMSHKLVQARKNSEYEKSIPGTFGKVVQNQLDEAGKGRLYIDAEGLVQTDEGKATLNRLIDNGVLDETEVNNAITKGSQIKVDSGKFFQTATDEDVTALEEHATFDKDGETIGAIKARREQLNKVMKFIKGHIVDSESKTAFAVLENMKKQGRPQEEIDAMQEILANGVENAGATYKEMLEQAKKDWLGYTDYETEFKGYKGRGVSIIRNDPSDPRGIRVSNNEKWYSEFYKNNGRAPTERELMDIASNEKRKAYSASHMDDEVNALDAAQTRYEALEGLENDVKFLNSADAKARVLLPKDVYENVYLPVKESLESGNSKVKESASDSALLYARVVDAFNRNYGIKVEPAQVITESTPPVGMNEDGAKDVRSEGVTSLSEFATRLGQTYKTKESPKDIKYTMKNGVIITGDRMNQILNSHNLVGAEISDLEKSLNDLYSPIRAMYEEKNFKKQHIGEHVLGLVKGGVNDYYVTLTFAKDGKIYLENAVANEKASIYKKQINAKIAKKLTDKESASLSDIQNRLGNDAENNIKAQKLRQEALQADAKLARDSQAWGETLDAIKDEKPLKNSIKVMDTPLALQLAGMDALPIIMDVSKIKKILRDHPSMTWGVLKQIPKELTKPIMVFMSDSVSGRYVVALELKGTNGVNVVVPFELRREKDHILANIITSAYTRGRRENSTKLDVNWFRKNAGNGKLLYVDTMRADTLLRYGQKKTTSFLQALGVQFSPASKKTSGLLTISIPTEKDLIKWKKEAPNYYQKAGKKTPTYLGSYDSVNNLIKVFKGGNQSTVIHEVGHFYLKTLENLAKDESIPEEKRKLIQKDLDAINEWASYHRTVTSKDYKETALEKEFTEYRKAINTATDDKSRAEAEERYKQERFARGLERYLMEGNAPTPALQSVFRRFKSWLVSIYKTIKNLGKEPLPDNIRTIFDKMVATDEEIEDWAAEQQFSDITGEIGKLDKTIDVSKSFAENIKDWITNVKETAKEKALKEFMQVYKDSQEQAFNEQIEAVKEGVREQILNESPEAKLAYETMANKRLVDTGQMDKATFDKMIRANGYHDYLSLKSVIDKLGGSLDDRVNAEVQKLHDQFVQAALTPEQIRGFADDQLMKESGKLRLAQIEKTEINKKLRGWLREYDKALLSLGREGIDSKEKRKRLDAVKRKFGLMTKDEAENYDARAQLGAVKARTSEKVKEAQESAKKAREDAKKRVENMQEEVSKVKEKLKKQREAIKDALSEFDYDNKTLREQALNTLADLPLRQSASWKWWNRRADWQATHVMNALKKGSWEKAARHQNQRLQYQMMASVAKQIADERDAMLHGSHNIRDMDGYARYGIQGILRRISRDKNPKILTESTRYVIEQLAYNLKISNNPGKAPINGFSWETLGKELAGIENMSETVDGKSTKSDSASIPDLIPDWIQDLILSDKRKPLGDLTYAQFKDINNCIQNLYKLGSREYQPNTLLDENGKKLTKDEAKAVLLNSMKPTLDAKGATIDYTPAVRNMAKTGKDRATRGIAKSMGELTLPEVMISRMGEDAYNLIYRPVDRAYMKRRDMENSAKIYMKEHTFGMYTKAEWDSIRNDRKYRFTLVSGRPAYMTKEEILSLALNLGTANNRDRVQTTMGFDIDAVQKFLADNMTDKDWDFVEAVWKHIGSFFDAENQAMVRMEGVQLEKEPGVDFEVEVKDANGKSHKRYIKGQYYPIRYDSSESVRSSDLANEALNMARVKTYNSLNRGMGSTKKRIAHTNQSLRRDLNVYIGYINDTINIISTREAITDVFKLISDNDIKRAICDGYGNHYYDWLRDWLKNSWRPPTDVLSTWEAFLSGAKQNFTYATMAFRTSTALLNATNIFPMADVLGVPGTISALTNFYGDLGSFSDKVDFIRRNSTFMANRGLNLDADLSERMQVPASKSNVPRAIGKALAKANRGLDLMNKHAYTLIEWTDEMFSLPLWYQTYQSEMMNPKGLSLSPEQLHERAVLEADRAVRKVFGSGEQKDKPAVQNGHLMKYFLPFYTYVNLMSNKFYKIGFDLIDNRPVNTLELARSVLFWWVLPAAAEALIRHGMGSLKSPDDKDKYSWLQRFGNAMFSGGPIGGTPIVSGVMSSLYGIFSGMGFSEGTAMTAAGSDALDSVLDGIKIIAGHGGISKDWIDVGRDLSRAANRTIIHGSDTLSDALWSMVRIMHDDAEGTVGSRLASIALDTPVKKSKDQMKKEQKEARREKKNQKRNEESEGWFN